MSVVVSLPTIPVLAAAFALHVVLHEAGHLLVARALGVRVEEFVLGRGPTVLNARLGGTDFSLRALPALGGDVRMAGMFEEHGRESFGAKPPWRKAAIIAAGSAVNLVSAALVLLAGHLIAGRPMGTSVGGTVMALARLTAGLGRAAAGLLTGDGLVEAAERALRAVEGLNVASGPLGFHLSLVALVGLYLGLFNLLPVPPLDGGRLAFVAAEKLRGRPIRAESADRATLCGLVVLCMFALFVAYEDLVHLVS